jgi:hypothetical protein
MDDDSEDGWAATLAADGHFLCKYKTEYDNHFAGSGRRLGH